MDSREFRICVEGVLLDLSILKEEYDIRTDLTQQVMVEGLDGRTSRLLKVSIPDFNVYLLETPYILSYISHPHIFGDSLEILLSKNSQLLRKAVERFALWRFGEVMSYDGLVERMGLDIPRSDQLRGTMDTVAIIVTPADGESIEVVEARARERGGRLRVILFLGPLSEEDVESLGDIANSLGVDAVFLALALLGRRNSNGSIVAYGADNGLLRRGIVRELGGIVDTLTLCRLLRNYPPGIDISGIRERLKPSLDYLRSVFDDLMLSLEMPIYDPWQVEIIMREAKSLRRRLMRYEERSRG